MDMRLHLNLNKSYLPQSILHYTNSLCLCMSTCKTYILCIQKTIAAHDTPMSCAAIVLQKI